MKSLKEQVDDFDNFQSLDIDPEDDPFAKREDDSDSDEAPSETGISGREHYEEVSKSKLRRPDRPVLGKEYTGAAVSRKTLFDDDGNAQKDDDSQDKEDEDGNQESESFQYNDSESPEPDMHATSNGSYESDDADLHGMGLEGLPKPQPNGSELDEGEFFASEEESGPEEKIEELASRKRDFVTEESAEEDSQAEGDSAEDGALMWDTDDEISMGDGEGIDVDDQMSESEAESEDISGGDSDSDSEIPLIDGSKQPENSRQKPKSLIANGDISESDLDSDVDMSDRPPTKPSTDRQKLKALLGNDAAAVASTLSASANADAQKGQAVKQQYQTFDRLLDARIKLQKGLTAAKDLSLPSNLDADVATAAQSAEAAALKLFSTIESVRHSILNASQDTMASGIKKRKRPSQATPLTSSTDLWSRLSTLEDASLPQRRAILNKWSSKTRSANGISASSSQLDRGPRLQESITDILDSQIISENQKSTKDTSVELYDDTTFYQSLLRDLISSRAFLSKGQSQLSDIPLPPAPKQHRKGVDVKASKGRKVRYTVHEKLQNFMAEEDRGTWTDSARAEFFASLFGGHGGLDEEVDVNGHDEGNEEEVISEEGALKLFRS